MAISYQHIRDDRQWRAATGLNKNQFYDLVESFKITYEDFLGQSIETSQTNSTNSPKLNTYEDFLFFILYSIKSGLTYDLLGLSFDMDRAGVFRHQTFGLRILEMSLQRLGHMPKRFYESLEDFKAHTSKQEQIILDASEQRRQRPQDQEDQKEDYSGKKKGIQ